MPHKLVPDTGAGPFPDGGTYDPRTWGQWTMDATVLTPGGPWFFGPAIAFIHFLTWVGAAGTAARNAYLMYATDLANEASSVAALVYPILIAASFVLVLSHTAFVIRESEYQPTFVSFFMLASMGLSVMTGTVLTAYTLAMGDTVIFFWSSLSAGLLILASTMASTFYVNFEVRGTFKGYNSS